MDSDGRKRRHCAQAIDGYVDVALGDDRHIDRDGAVLACAATPRAEWLSRSGVATRTITTTTRRPKITAPSLIHSGVRRRLSPSSPNRSEKAFRLSSFIVDLEASPGGRNVLGVRPVEPHAQVRGLMQRSLSKASTGTLSEVSRKPRREHRTASGFRLSGIPAV